MTPANVEPVDILLVEDNPTDAELAMKALRKRSLDHAVMWIKDGAEALDFVFGRGRYSGRAVGLPPKVILLDLRLPKVDGIEVLRTLKNDPRTRTIPVVMLTSSKEHQDIDESYRLGVNSYVGKPVRYHEFLRVVSEIECYWLSMNHAPSTPPFRLPPCPNP